jgi:hypothetical protein
MKVKGTFFIRANHNKFDTRMFYVHLAPLSPEAKKRVLLIEKVVGVAVIVVLLIVMVWQAPAISSFFSGQNNGESEYSQLSLAVGQYVTYTHNDSNYVFSYSLSATDITGLFYVVKDSQQTRSYPATSGAVYQDLGLEMKVSSTTSNIAIILVKPIST